MRSRRALLALAVAVPLGGCLGVVPFQPRAYDDAARVRSMGVESLPDGSARLRLDLGVRNPSSDAATLTRVDFAVRLVGRGVAVTEQTLDVPVDSEREVEVKVALVLPNPRPQASVRGDAPPDTEDVMVDVEGGVVLRFGGVERRAPFKLAAALRVPRAVLPEAGTER
ncbi:hypothetical protein DRW03_30325 [Corallococcus sp. H22C18031201]|nr:hypothetical protein DRW03_30325 [Corallococcus sp. H22C18031201]